MGFLKVIKSGDIIETYEYERIPRGGKRKRRGVSVDDGMSHVHENRPATEEEKRSFKARRHHNARRTRLAFTRLVRANLLLDDHPLLFTLTYAQNMGSLEQAHKDWNAFARAARAHFGEGIRYITVAEYQKRGAVHFHAFIWGLPTDTVETERFTRVCAKLWGHGFVDIKHTDGNEKLAGYLAKYMTKMFRDPRLGGKRHT